MSKAIWGTPSSLQMGLQALEYASEKALSAARVSLVSMVCYIGLGWAILPFLKQTLQVLTLPGFLLLLLGGIAYTIGAVLYGIGSKKRWMHSVFHIFVVLGSVLQFFAVLLYGI